MSGNKNDANLMKTESNVETPPMSPRQNSENDDVFIGQSEERMGDSGPMTLRHKNSFNRNKMSTKGQPTKTLMEQVVGFETERVNEEEVKQSSKSNAFNKNIFISMHEIEND